jgi:hypothetical protein
MGKLLDWIIDLLTPAPEPIPIPIPVKQPDRTR